MVIFVPSVIQLYKKQSTQSIKTSRIGRHHYRLLQGEFVFSHGLLNSIPLAHKNKRPMDYMLYASYLFYSYREFSNHVFSWRWYVYIAKLNNGCFEKLDFTNHFNTGKNENSSCVVHLLDTVLKMCNGYCIWRVFDFVSCSFAHPMVRFLIVRCCELL